MSLILNLDVGWPNGRVIHVRCLGLPLVSDRSVRELSPTVMSLDTDDVATLPAFHGFLRSATRIVAHEATVEVVGFEPTVLRVLELLEVEGPPPDPLVVMLPPVSP